MVGSSTAPGDTFGLQKFQYSNPQVLQKVKNHLEGTNFTGITVPVAKATSINKKDVIWDIYNL